MDLTTINCYVIRVNTIDNLYVDYMVEAKNIFQAKNKKRKPQKVTFQIKI